jgi:hypothetical protein
MPFAEFGRNPNEFKEFFHFGPALAIPLFYASVRPSSKECRMKAFKSILALSLVFSASAAQAAGGPVISPSSAK